MTLILHLALQMLQEAVDGDISTLLRMRRYTIDRGGWGLGGFRAVVSF